MTLAHGDCPTKVALTGQLLLARPLHDSRHGPFLDLVDQLRDADVAVTGLEGVLAGKGWPSPKATSHVLPRSVAETIAWMGFRLVALAGNHAFDLGPQGIVHTVQVLQDYGVVTAGTGEDPDSANQAAVLPTPTGRGIALLSRQLGPQAASEAAVGAVPREDAPEAQGCRPGVAHIGVDRVVTARPEIFAALETLLEESGHTPRHKRRVAMGAETAASGVLDAWGTAVVAGTSNREAWRVDQRHLDDLLRRIRRLKRSGASAVVHLHNHYWASQPSVVPGWFSELAASAAAAGAAVVVGHGYPGLQALQLQDGKLIAHGMGSLAFHTRRPLRYSDLHFWESVVVLAQLTSSGLCEKVELLPVIHGEHPWRTRRESDLGEPELADFEVGKAVLERLNLRCATFASRVVITRSAGRAVGELVEDASIRPA